MTDAITKNDTSRKRRINLTMHFSQFQLPPAQDALVIGKRAPIGSNGIARAFEEMLPGTFRLIPVDHPVIEALLVRQADLRKIPEQELINRLIENAEPLMDATEALHVKNVIEVIVEEHNIQV